MSGIRLITACCISVLIAAATGCADYEIDPCTRDGLTSCFGDCADLVGEGV
jgi:hypothetical protein